MSIDTDPSQTTLTASPEHASCGHSEGQSGASNTAVIAAIQGHHAELAARADVLTRAVIDAVPNGQYLRARDELCAWYRGELLPHAVAEEQALYRPAAELDAMRLLIQGMLAEHRSLISLIATLAEVSGAADVVAAAAATRSVFTVHVSKENELLLPALDQAGVDLARALNGMHDLLGHSTESQVEEAGCGCGCGCADDAAGQSAGTLQITTNPTLHSEELDVRALPHGARHEIIFSKLDQLEPAEALVIVNDHDPKPLRYQTSAMWPDRYVWDYLEAGPAIWRVAITRAG